MRNSSQIWLVSGLGGPRAATREAAVAHFAAVAAKSAALDALRRKRGRLRRDARPKERSGTGTRFGPARAGFIAGLASVFRAECRRAYSWRLVCAALAGGGTVCALRESGQWSRNGLVSEAWRPVADPQSQKIAAPLEPCSADELPRQDAPPRGLGMTVSMATEWRMKAVPGLRCLHARKLWERPWFRLTEAPPRMNILDSSSRRDSHELSRLRRR